MRGQEDVQTLPRRGSRGSEMMLEDCASNAQTGLSS